MAARKPPPPAPPPDDTRYTLVRDGLLRGEGAALIPLARAVHEAEAGSLRASVALAVCLQRGGALDEADAVLVQATQRHGAHAVLSVNRAKVAADRGDEKAADALLSAALDADPNDEAALLWWAARVRLRADDTAFQRALEEHTRKKGSWRAHLLLYGHALEGDRRADARAHLVRAVRASGPSPNACAEIAVALARAGAHDDLLAAFSPYRPAEHGLVVGLELVRAAAARGDAAAAAAALSALRAHPRARGTAALAQAEDAVAALARADSARARDIVGLAIAAPLADSILGGAPRRAAIAVCGIADTTDAHAVAGPVDDARERARAELCRGLTLSLTESLADAGAYTLLPAIGGVGLVSARRAFSLDALIALLPSAHLPQLVVVGELRATVTGEALTLRVHDLARRADIGEVSVDAAQPPDDVARAARDALAPLLTRAQPRLPAAPSGAPPASPLTLAALLPLALAHARVVPFDATALADACASVVARTRGQREAAPIALAALVAARTAEVPGATALGDLARALVPAGARALADRVAALWPPANP